MFFIGHEILKCDRFRYFLRLREACAVKFESRACWVSISRRKVNRQRDHAMKNDLFYWKLCSNALNCCVDNSPPASSHVSKIFTQSSFSANTLRKDKRSVLVMKFMFELWKKTWRENPAHELKINKSSDGDVIRAGLLYFFKIQCIAKSVRQECISGLDLIACIDSSTWICRQANWKVTLNSIWTPPEWMGIPWVTRHLCTAPPLSEWILMVS